MNRSQAYHTCYFIKGKLYYVRTVTQAAAEAAKVTILAMTEVTKGGKRQDKELEMSWKQNRGEGGQGDPYLRQPVFTCVAKDNTLNK